MGATAETGSRLKSFVSLAVLPGSSQASLESNSFRQGGEAVVVVGTFAERTT